MQHQGNGRRAYGTGSLYEQRGAWYGKWRVGDRQVKRKIGPKRRPGTREGLTQTQAEARLRKMMQELRVAPPDERVTLKEAGAAYLQHLESVMHRKRATVQDYRIMLRRHLEPFFGATAIDRISADDVAAYLHMKVTAGYARQTILNQLNFLHGVFRFAVKRRWATMNPVAMVDRPRSQGGDPDVRFLDGAELEALVRATPEDRLGQMERVLYLTAAMTGLRQGELVALRWSDVDWTAGVVRVRRNLTRGELGPPKSRRSSRAVPLADRLAGELDCHFKRSIFQADEDLVFCHPDTGNPYDASKLRKRFKDALKRARVTRTVRFHDLRHTFGTRMAAAGVPMRTLQEFMGHRDIATTLVYADYAPSGQEGEFIERAFKAPTSSIEEGATSHPRIVSELG
jgi:integrase